MANRREKVEIVTDFIISGFKITVDNNHSPEIRRRLLFGENNNNNNSNNKTTKKNTMTNLDSILKSRDITLLTKSV